MNKLENIQKYFNTSMLQEGTEAYLMDALLTVLLAYLLGILYEKFGRSLSNRKSFANNFVLLALTTMTIITVVKSSLALSLGLVGALSIVRFRAAIKDPEELTYLFAVISIGLGMGAGQRYIILISFLIFVCVIVLRGLKKKESLDGNLLVTLTFKESPDVNIDKVTEKVEKYASHVKFKRIDEYSDTVEYVFSSVIKDIKNIDKIREELKKDYKDVNLSFMEDNGLFNL